MLNNREGNPQIAPEQYGTRNDALTFAARTRKNLQFILDARLNHEDVHPVTQIVNSMLGLLVFPQQKGFEAAISNLSLVRLSSERWPRIEITLGKCETLGELVRHMRNAAAHRRIVFDSDSSDKLQEVIITFSDKQPKDKEITWTARASASDLQAFAFRFVELLETYAREGSVSELSE